MGRGTASDRILESDVQGPSVAHARSRGWFARRYKGPGRRSHPDYLFAKHGFVFWVEFKRPGGAPTDLQWIEIRLMQSHGLTVYWVDNLADFQAILRSHEKP